ncbi:AMP nucleosidase [Parasphingorhabdus halotolerans]|uniref:AMP nucleosidase n=1 Tax=Parasphingorhabdus halotolerans TaxID=2725558 RepID=A0A6H2DR58_9SPHN|nr:AMP nucleosidase [Parasphingorhabdus halotolerans]QJB70435.1 AMP nucleosidase [Parasphingorhabdus halotolerans]
MTVETRVCAGPAEAVALLEKLYAQQIEVTAARFGRYASQKLESDDRQQGLYPQITVEIPASQATETSHLASGQLSDINRYSTTITEPTLYRRYLLEQLSRINETFTAKISVGLSDTPIPLAFALEDAAAGLDRAKKEKLPNYFHTPNLVKTNDEIVDGGQIFQTDEPSALSLFTAERVDYSLHRIRHYCASAPEHFQPFILFTNYQRYVDEFIEYSLEQVKSGESVRLVEPGNRITERDGKPSAPPIAKPPQMPAYHLVRKDGRPGVTLVNIGVGPSNAKTITDHLAVLRPHVWLMIGHCGALRRTQRLGDYVLAHAYLRDDNVLDEVLPPSIPLPTIAEVQQALTRAVQEETGIDASKLKQQLRTGTVVTTGDRNWELRFEQIAVRLNQSRAIAIDMESATVAANGYRYRVPYGTLLCASDKPLHGEIKLPGMADAFYQERVGQHLAIGLRAIDLLAKEADAGTLHSRKLRSFGEPLFR